MYRFRTFDTTLALLHDIRAMDAREQARQLFQEEHSGVDWTAVRFGTMSDRRLAKYYNVGEALMTRMRLSYHVPESTTYPALRDFFTNHPNSAVDWTKEPLGLVTDREIAKRLQVSHNTVSRQRRQRGIPKFIKPNVAINHPELFALDEKALIDKLGCSARSIKLARKMHRSHCGKRDI